MIIQQILTKLAEKRPVFHSEADFQHELAYMIHQMQQDAQVRLEKPFDKNDQTRYLDVWIDHGGQKTAIELKYKTKKPKSTIEIQDETFELKEQSANDCGRYDFIKDVERLEDIISQGKASVGYAILLTNDSKYWDKSRARIGTNDEKFRIHENKTIKEKMDWPRNPEPKSLGARKNSITLTGEYKCIWKDYSPNGDASEYEFKYLLIEVPKQPDQ